MLSYDYLLFVDTETSGLPKDWHAPYNRSGNWPYIVQLAWVVFNKQGQELKRENHFIKPTDYEVSSRSREIHGISDDFLRINGHSRAEVMRRLQGDLENYRPLVISHFMQLDYHMMSLGFQRAGLRNPLKKLPVFCTMLATSSFTMPAGQKYLRLGELHKRLFHELQQNEHNALSDALATARCFFAMRERRDIQEESIQEQAQRHNFRDFMKKRKSTPQQHVRSGTSRSRKRVEERNRAFMWIGIFVVIMLVLILLAIYGQ